MRRLRFLSLLMAITFFGTHSAFAIACALGCHQLQPKEAVASCHQASPQEKAAPLAGPGIQTPPEGCPILASLERKPAQAPASSLQLARDLPAATVLPWETAALAAQSLLPGRFSAKVAESPLPVSLPLYLQKRVLLL